MATCGCGRKGSRMQPLYEDPWFTFRFADDRLIARFHERLISSTSRYRFEPHLFFTARAYWIGKISWAFSSPSFRAAW